MTLNTRRSSFRSTTARATRATLSSVIACSQEIPTSRSLEREASSRPCSLMAYRSRSSLFLDYRSRKSLRARRLRSMVRQRMAPLLPRKMTRQRSAPSVYLRNRMPLLCRVVICASALTVARICRSSLSTIHAPCAEVKSKVSFRTKRRDE